MSETIRRCRGAPPLTTTPQAARPQCWGTQRQPSIRTPSHAPVAKCRQSRIGVCGAMGTSVDGRRRPRQQRPQHHHRLRTTMTGGATRAGPKGRRPTATGTMTGAGATTTRGPRRKPMRGPPIIRGPPMPMRGPCMRGPPMLGPPIRPPPRRDPNIVCCRFRGVASGV